MNLQRCSLLAQFRHRHFFFLTLFRKVKKLHVCQAKSGSASPSSGQRSVRDFDKIENIENASKRINESLLLKHQGSVLYIFDYQLFCCFLCFFLPGLFEAFSCQNSRFDWIPLRNLLFVVGRAIRGKNHCIFWCFRCFKCFFQT